MNFMLGKVFVTVEELWRIEGTEEETATHSNILAWRISWTAEGACQATVHGVAESDMTEWLSTAQHILKT